MLRRVRRRLLRLNCWRRLKNLNVSACSRYIKPIWQ
jgi:hypothetical protein